ncbi:MAG: HAD family phosphatase [Anaerolineaceae bacterium]|nr:HAD family phosphatase [Anaerolineaceae bacterium]
MDQHIKAVIFDMGGVILRSDDLTSRQELANRYAVTEEQLEDIVFDSPTAKVATVGQISEREHWQEVFAMLNVRPEDEQAFQDAFWAGDRIDRGLVKFLSDFRPHYQTGLLSNAWSGARDMLTQKYQAIDAFDTSIFSFEVGMAKPDPAIYHYILDLMQVKPEEAIFLDDFERNIIAANQVGIHGVRFLNREQAMRDILALLND